MTNKLKIMTYNICWEAIEAKKGNIDMTKCKVKMINHCKKNIKNIINDKLKDNFDFICLQEINSKQWENLSSQ